MQPRGIASGRLLLLLFLLAAVVGGIVFYYAQQRRDRPVPNIDGLRRELERSAEATLPDPTFTTEQLRIKKPEGEVEKEIGRLINVADKLGGFGMETVDSEHAAVLAQIPSARLGEFRQAVTGQSSPASTPAAAADATELIEVVVEKLPR